MTSRHAFNDGCGGPAATPGSRVLALSEVAALVVLATFLVATAWTGRVRLFVAASYVWLPPAAGVLLLAMAVARLVRLRPGCAGDACADAHKPPTSARRVLYALVLLLPVGLALAINPQQFSADGVRKRRAPSAARDVALEQAVAWILGRPQAPPAGTAPVLLPAEPTVRDLLALAEQGQQPDLAGRFVTLVGQCSPRDSGAGRRFDLYRLLVTCCIADAQALSIEVVSPAGTLLEDGQWIRVGGVVRFDSPSGPALPVLHAAKIEKIPLPPRPYL